MIFFISLTFVFLFQHHKLRQLILKQQHHKRVIRQEMGLQETTINSAPGTPLHWSQEDSGPHHDVFGRPPPPYPGSVRPSLVQGGQRCPGNFPDETHGPRPHFSRDMNNVAMRPQGAR